MQSLKKPSQEMELAVKTLTVAAEVVRVRIDRQKDTATWLRA